MTNREKTAIDDVYARIQRIAGRLHTYKLARAFNGNVAEDLKALQEESDGISAGIAVLRDISLSEKSARDVLLILIEVLTTNLNEIQDVKDEPEQQFVYGEKFAYVECLEVIARWVDARKYGVPEDVEKVYPLTEERRND